MNTKLYDKDLQVVWDSDTADQSMEDFLSDRFKLIIVKRHHDHGVLFSGPLRVIGDDV